MARQEVPQELLGDEDNSLRDRSHVPVIRSANDLPDGNFDKCPEASERSFFLSFFLRDLSRLASQIRHGEIGWCVAAGPNFYSRLCSSTYPLFSSLFDTVLIFAT